MRDRGFSEFVRSSSESSAELAPARRRFLGAVLAGSAWHALARVPMSVVAAGALPAASLHAAPGTPIAQLPAGLVGKEGLRLLNDRPVNAETPAHLLDDDITPAKYLFVRNNGVPPG